MNLYGFIRATKAFLPLLKVIPPINQLIYRRIPSNRPIFHPPPPHQKYYAGLRQTRRPGPPPAESAPRRRQLQRGRRAGAAQRLVYVNAIHPSQRHTDTLSPAHRHTHLTGYAAAKHACDGWLGSLRVECKVWGVEVAAVCPCWHEVEIESFDHDVFASLPPEVQVGGWVGRLGWWWVASC